jgi:hypothetical protein
MADGEKSGGGSSTAIVAIVAICAVVAVLYFMFGRGMLNGTPDKIDADVTITTPATK